MLFFNPRVLSIVAVMALSVPAFAEGTTLSADKTPPNDAQIIQSLVTSNNVDIDAAKLAERKTESQEVKTFAARMITDHSDSNTKTNTLAKKLKITPQASPSAKDMREQSDEKISMLKSKTGKDFDKAYVDYQVTFHEGVLDELDRKLMPNAKNPEIKTLLEGKRSVVAAHLEHAKQLQTSLH